MDSLMFNIVLKVVLIIVITVISVVALETHAPIVQGYVYCKSCKDNTLAGAASISGAIVRLQCNSTQKVHEQESTTNKNGYFAINTPPSATIAEIEQCKVVLVSSSSSSSSSSATSIRQQKETTICSIPTDINSGVSGAVLKYSHKVINKQTLSVQAFTVGPFAFQPQTELLKETCTSSNTDGCDPQCLFICAGCCHCTY